MLFVRADRHQTGSRHPWSHVLLQLARAILERVGVVACADLGCVSQLHEMVHERRVLHGLE